MYKVLFIVEGTSDKSFYRPIFRLLLQPNINFEVVGFDLTSKYDKSDDAIEIVEHFIADRFRKKIFNFNKIVMISDIDACFINADRVKFDQHADKKWYDDSYMYFNDITHQIFTNIKKGINLQCLYHADKVYNTDFEIYYNCINLEHVYYDDPNIDGNKKGYIARECAERFCNDLGTFLDFLHDKNLLLSEDYYKSWDALEEDNISLRRLTNLWVFFNRHPDYLNPGFINRGIKPKVSNMNIV